MSITFHSDDLSISDPVSRAVCWRVLLAGLAVFWIGFGIVLYIAV